MWSSTQLYGRIDLLSSRKGITIKDMLQRCMFVYEKVDSDRGGNLPVGYAQSERDRHLSMGSAQMTKLLTFQNKSEKKLTEGGKDVNR
jgi:hypothetical protein